MTYNLPIESIIDDYMDGMGTKRIADKYRITKSCVKDRLKKEGVYRVLTPKQIDYQSIVADYIAGESIRGLAKKYNVTRETVRKAVIKWLNKK